MKGDLDMQTKSNWNDVSVYSVNFITLDGRQIEKVLVFPKKFTKEAIEKTILKKFLHIDKIEKVEEWYEALSLK